MLRIRERLTSSVRVLVTALIMASTPHAAESGAEAVASARGSISADGESTTLEHVSLGALYGDTVVVLVSDVELEPPCDVHSAMAIAEKQPLTGVLFTIETDTLEQLVEGGLNTLFVPGVEPYEGYGAITSGLSLERVDGVARGTLETSAALNETTYEVAVELSIPLVIPAPPVPPRSVTGADSDPGKAFVRLVDSVMTGDFESVKGLATAELRGQMEQVDPEEAGEALAAFAEFLLPERIAITDTSVEGDRAVLSAEGVTQACLGPEQSTGTIELQREGTAWKIASVKFEG
jgi:hypothetical protein